MPSCKMVEKSFQAFSVAEHRTRGGEMFPMLVVEWQASVVRGKEAGRFCEVAGVSIITAGSPQLTLLTIEN